MTICLVLEIVFTDSNKSKWAGIILLRYSNKEDILCRA